MDTTGAFKGYLASDLMPLSGTHEGGRWSLWTPPTSPSRTPATSKVKATSGQSYPTEKALEFQRGLSRWGASPRPIRCGTAATACCSRSRPRQVNKRASSAEAYVVTPCANLSEAELKALGDEMSPAAEATANIRDNVPPVYAVYMF